MKCKKCGEENAMLKRCCSRCGAFLEGYTVNNVTGELGYRGGDGNFYKSEKEYKKKSENCNLNNMKYYIAGKIGEEKPSPATLAKFKEAEERLLAEGYEVFNPTTSGYGKLADEKVREAMLQGKRTDWYQEILKLDLDALSFCDGIYLLKDYKESDGARIEYDFALANKKKFLFQEFFHGVDFLSLEFDRKVNQGTIEVAPEKSYYKVREDWGIKNIDRVWLQL